MIIDFLVIGAILLSIFLGYKKGLIGLAFRILSFFIAIIITLLLYKPIATYITKYTTIDDKINSIIIEKLSFTKVEEGEKIEKEETNLPNVIVNYINDGVENAVSETKDNVIEVVANTLTENVINVIVILGIFVISKLILLFAKVILEAVTEIPLIKQFNEIGGIIYGLVRAIFIIYIILTIISFISPMIEQTGILEMIQKTMLTSWLYNNNLILILFFS